MSANGAVREAGRAGDNGASTGATRPAPAAKPLAEAVLRFGVPEKGRIGEVTLPFLDSCGLRIKRESERQLTAGIGGLPGVTVIFQRAEDILTHVADGKIDVGITGIDIVTEHEAESAEVVVLHEQLGFSNADVVVAVPDSWVDVSTLADLADIAAEMRERGDELRVATKFPNMVRRFLYAKGITHFSLVLLSGGHEAAPGVGFADVVVDVTSTGTTIRENHLKVLRNGVVLRSQAALIGNRRALSSSPEKRELTRRILETIEARRRAEDCYSITANLRGGDEREVAQALLRSPVTRGKRGPTVARVFTAEQFVPEGSGGGDWFAATVIVAAQDLQAAIDHLRAVGGSSISVLPVRYLFEERSSHYESMLAELGVKREPAPA